MFVKIRFHKFAQRIRSNFPLLSFLPFCLLLSSTRVEEESLESWKVGDKGVLYIGCNRHVGPMKKVSKGNFFEKISNARAKPSSSFTRFVKTSPLNRGDFSSSRDATLNFERSLTTRAIRNPLQTEEKNSSIVSLNVHSFDPSFIPISFDKFLNFASSNYRIDPNFLVQPRKSPSSPPGCVKFKNSDRATRDAKCQPGGGSIPVAVISTCASLHVRFEAAVNCWANGALLTNLTMAALLSKCNNNGRLTRAPVLFVGKTSAEDLGE